ncbi:expressed protein [Batrachochytrium dendrobatidis JAM81]|uniref:Expressed protein n=3 Tax=Batrachochytrium dendrobatidis TaxID=109871 RepID=F4NRS6_BATDJ|nr:uncharacterized protein BATDEDRAFT_34143 [Batrachochytrium dendrobatidis JAM81]EGF83367.1 expressed protein [Batrachochytrium dendrobatidis JAM81]OAJ36827.1 hypothetical protein BDEG_20955 [Batrachochytrium dendrobatidis JEL423]|eukprot:XP_006675762.1 expressed protein [Batrachochytrium dendrobatidis JAM81]
MAKEKVQRLRTCPLCHKEFAAKTVSNHRSQLVCVRRRQIQSSDIECWRQDFQNDPTMLDKLLRFYKKQQQELQQADYPYNPDYQETAKSDPPALPKLSIPSVSTSFMQCPLSTSQSPSPTLDSINTNQNTAPVLNSVEIGYERFQTNRTMPSIYSGHSFDQLSRSNEVELPLAQTFSYGAPSKWTPSHVHTNFRRIDIPTEPIHDPAWYSVQHAMRPMSNQLPLLPPMLYPGLKPISSHLNGFGNDFEMGHRPIMTTPLNHFAPPMMPPTTMHQMLHPIGHLNFNGFHPVSHEHTNFIYDNQASDHSTRGI